MSTHYLPLPVDAQQPLLTPKQCLWLFVRICLYVLLYMAYNHGIFWDASRHTDLHWKFSEWSFTEFSQSVILLLATAGLLYIRRKFNIFPVGTLVMASFTFVSLIRENDYWTDMVLLHAWMVAVWVIIVLALVYAYKHRKVFLDEMRLYFTTLPFGLFLGGFLTTYVYSRLFGRAILWETSLAGHYIRTAKDMGEECTESIGYLLILLSVIELYFLAKRLRAYYGQREE